MRVSKAKQAALSHGRLRELLSYDPGSGLFVWLNRSGNGQFNKVFAGKVAGGAHQSGYLIIEIGHRAYYAHRLAWLYVSGNWPEYDVDHIDGNRTNNRLANLRSCIRAENMQNYKRPTTNTSGFLGVSPHGNNWRAVITAGGRKIYLGTFRTREQAHDAYLAAKAKYHYFQPVPRELAA